MKFPGNAANRSRQRTRAQKGIALITALLLLALLTGLSIAMFLTVNSDLLTNGYYRNFRGSYYAADSGLAVVRQDMKNKIVANMVTANADTPPINSGIETAVLTSLKSAWASDSNFQSLTQGAKVSDSIGAQFRIEPGTFTLTGSCSADPGNVACDGATGVTQWNYTYAYHMVAVGQAGVGHQNRIEEGGTLTVTVPVGVQIPGSWAGYGMYVTNQDACPSSRSPFAKGTISGPVYSGGCFTFGTSGSYTFTDPVACGGSKAGYQFSDTCKLVAGPSATNGTGWNKVTIAPDFKGGIYFDQKEPTLPTDSFNQKRAVLDGIGQTKTNEQTWQDIASGQKPATDSAGVPINPLRDVTGATYQENATSGVYVSYDDATNKITGGGIYVAGDASVTLTTSSSSSQIQQIYTVVNNGVTTTITYTWDKNLNWQAATPYNPSYTIPGSGKVEIASGSNLLKLNGVSYSRDTSGNFIDNATILYVNGNVTSLHGDVQDDNALNITAAGDITVDANLTYQTKPLTTADNELYIGTGKDKRGLNADTVVPAQLYGTTNSNGKVMGNNGQALGLFTADGNIITTLKNSGTLEVDASLATISQHLDKNGNWVPGDGGLVIPNTSAMINYLNIMGGRVNNALYSTSKLGQRNLYFDRRFGSSLTPPFFPGARPQNYQPPDGTTQVRFHRQQWVNQTSY